MAHAPDRISRRIGEMNARVHHHVHHNEPLQKNLFLQNPDVTISHVTNRMKNKNLNANSSMCVKR